MNPLFETVLVSCDGERLEEQQGFQDTVSRYYRAFRCLYGMGDIHGCEHLESITVASIIKRSIDGSQRKPQE